MKIELKGIKHYPSLSEETNCYEASLYVDGKKIGTVSNRGTGGCDSFYGDHAACAAANDWCKANLPTYTFEIGGEHHTNPTDIEMHCASLLEDHIVTKELTAAMKKTALFILSDERGLYRTGYKAQRGAKPKAPDEALFDHVRKKHHGAVILNTMPLADAIAAYRNA